MSLAKISGILENKLQEMQAAGLAKGAEKVITSNKPAKDGKGPRCLLAGYGDREFLRMNSNSYLGLQAHPAVIAAEEQAARAFGAGPGAVRFISGTHQAHIELEQHLARFHDRPAGMIFSAAYATVMGVVPPLVTNETIVLSDALNHNCIINAARLARPARKVIHRHLDMDDFEKQLRGCIGQAARLLVITDGVFSMRGDHAPLAGIEKLCRQYEEHFNEGIISIVDDSHGVGALGETGRGVEELTGGRADILIATLGKTLGVNGGYAVSASEVIAYLRETSPFYVYSNPITPSETAASTEALRILDSDAGLELLANMRRLTRLFEQGLLQLGCEIIPSPHPIVPLMIRDTQKTATLTQHLFDHGILATGLNYPVVPAGDEEIRFQISASHTQEDIEYVLSVLAEFLA